MTELDLLDNNALIDEIGKRFEHFAFVGVGFGSDRGTVMPINTNTGGDNFKILGLLTFLESTILDDTFPDVD